MGQGAPPTSREEVRRYIQNRLGGRLPKSDWEIEDVQDCVETYLTSRDLDDLEYCVDLVKQARRTRHDWLYRLAPQVAATRKPRSQTAEIPHLNQSAGETYMVFRVEHVDPT